MKRFLVGLVVLSVLGLIIAPVGQSVVQAAPEAQFKSTTTYLVVGLDHRDWDPDQPNEADSILVVTHDFFRQKVTVEAISRQLEVDIPGYGLRPILMAYEIGGMDLLQPLVEDLMGVTMDYHVAVEFEAFRIFIDEIFGIHVQVPEITTIDLVGNDPPITLDSGGYDFNGAEALAYTRALQCTGALECDYERIERQQLVLLAIQDKAKTLIPQLIFSASSIYRKVSPYIETNMGAQQMLQYGLMMLNTPNIEFSMIGF